MSPEDLALCLDPQLRGIMAGLCRTRIWTDGHPKSCAAVLGAWIFLGGLWLMAQLHKDRAA